MIAPRRALERLREGNRRFASGARSDASRASPSRRDELVSGQEPWAVILGCSDSRVPAEIVFDQGLGDLFVVRVAGNVAGPVQVGSVEFAAQVLGTRLVVVLGHSGCGAVTAAVQELRGEEPSPSPNLRSVVDPIRSSLESLPATRRDQEVDLLVRRGVRANVLASADRLRRDSRILGDLVEEDGLLIVGAEYSLETGVVDFYEG